LREIEKINSMKTITCLITILFIGLNVICAQSKIEDSDGDTHVNTYHPWYDDEILFTLDGDLKWKMVGNRLETGNPAANVMIGFGAGSVNTGTINTFVGNSSGEDNTNGHNNVAIGTSALRNNVGGSYNTAIGAGALKNYQSTGPSGENSTALGNEAGNSITSGVANTFLGAKAGEDLTSGGYNLIAGMAAGRYKSTGSSNVILGYGANSSGGSGSNNVFIGFQSARFETGSNKLYIENSSSSDPLIYGEFDNDELTINGFATVDRLDGGEEVARFVSQSEPQITLYRGSTHAGDLQHYKQDLVLSNRENKGSVLVQTTNGGSTSVAAAFYPDGDLDVTGDRIYFGNTEYLQDVGWRRIETNASIQPSTCGYRDLGSSAHRWDQVYIDNAVLIASCFSSGGGSGTGSLAGGEGDEYGLTELMELRSVQGFKNKSNEITVTQLQEVMPGLVEEYDEVVDEKTEEITLVPSENPSIRITDFIPVLVKSVQDQSIVVQKQEEMISILIEELSDMRKSVEHLERELYKQETAEKENKERVSFVCKPNPANGFLNITYAIAPSWKSAQIRLTDMQGRVLISKPLSQDQNEMQINTSGIASGSYIYSLVKNGVVQRSEKVVIVD